MRTHGEEHQAVAVERNDVDRVRDHGEDDETEDELEDTEDGEAARVVGKMLLSFGADGIVLSHGDGGSLVFLMLVLCHSYSVELLS